MARTNATLPPYIKWRDGRPRWEPSPRLRALGLKARDLRDSQTGAWLSLEATRTLGQAWAARISAWVEGGQHGPPPELASGAVIAASALPPASRTIAQSIALYLASDAYQRLAKSSRADYRVKLRSLGTMIGEDIPLAALRPRHLVALHARMARERGAAMAHGTMGVARAWLAWCVVHLEWISANPVANLRFARAAGRLRCAWPEEIEALVSAADELGWPEIGDAIVLGVQTGQRLGDVLSLKKTQLAGDAIALTQSKTGAVVRVPLMARALDRLAGARARWQSSQWLVSPPAGAGGPWDTRAFAKRFARVRAHAAAGGIGNGIGSTGGCISLLGQDARQPTNLEFRDLRDTAVTRLALAGCSIFQICAITGHSPKSIDLIMRHYLVVTDGLAQSAVDLLTDWMRKEGISA